MNKALILFMLLFFISGCSKLGISGHSVKEKAIPAETSQEPIVLFCPRDNCTKALVSVINLSQEYVHCAFFDLDLNEVIKIAGEKSKNTDVRLVIDNDNNNGLVSGDSVRFDSQNQLSHNKFCVIDGYIVSTGSFNPTQRDAYYNNNNLIIFSSRYLAENYENEFNELWNGYFGEGGKVEYPVVYINGNKVENYFCPDDKCSEKVINALNSAKESIYFMTFSFTKEDIADAILFKNNIDIKGVFDKTQSGSKYSQ